MRRKHTNISQNSSSSQSSHLSSFKVQEQIGLFTFYNQHANLKEDLNLSILQKANQSKHKNKKIITSNYEKKPCFHPERNITKIIQEKRAEVKPQLITLSSRMASSNKRNLQNKTNRRKKYQQKKQNVSKKLFSERSSPQANALTQKGKENFRIQSFIRTIEALKKGKFKKQQKIEMKCLERKYDLPILHKYEQDKKKKTVYGSNRFDYLLGGCNWVNEHTFYR